MNDSAPYRTRVDFLGGPAHGKSADVVGTPGFGMIVRIPQTLPTYKIEHHYYCVGSIAIYKGFTSYQGEDK